MYMAPGEGHGGDWFATAELRDKRNSEYEQAMDDASYEISGEPGDSPRPKDSNGSAPVAGLSTDRRGD